MELMNGRAEEMTESRKEARRAPRAANLIGTVTRTKEAPETKARAEARTRVKPEQCYDCGEQGHVGVNCRYKWTNNTDEEEDQGSSWESEPEGENAEGLAYLEAPDDEGEWCWPRRNRITR